uniref:BTB domain-containing protein n=1 Tax=Syphacia muris TaxID=451379 RepID=A0A0N5AF75_9BILA
MDDSMDFIPTVSLSGSSCCLLDETFGHGHHQSSSLQNAALSSNNLETEFIDSMHAGIVLSNLSSFRDHKFMCDVEIEVDGQVFLAHGYVLAAAIPYFHSMFSSDMMEAHQKRIVIKDLPVNSFKQLLNYAYTSKIRITEENVQQLLYAASILQMDAVCGACQKFLTQYLTTSNCLSIRQFAEQHNCVSLMSSVDSFTMDHFPELRNSSEFLQIPPNHLKDLLRSSDLKVDSEVEVFETVIEWVEEDVDERKSLLPELLDMVRLPELPAPYLLETVRNHRLIVVSFYIFDKKKTSTWLIHFFVQDCPKCSQIVADAVAEVLRLQIAALSNDGAVMSELKALRNVNISSPDMVSTNMCSLDIEGYNANDIFSLYFLLVITIKFVVIGKKEGLQYDFTNRQVLLENKWRNCKPRKSASGVVFCVGGRGTLGDPFRSVEAYDWRKNKWFPISDMNIKRRHVGVVSALGKLYAIGGHDGSNHLDTAECFDPATNMWHNVASMETRRRGIAVGTLVGAIYAVGGLDDTACFQTVERYDIEADKWSPVASMNVQRGGVGVAALGRHLYAVGGNDGTSSLDSCERYDPVLNKWVLVANMQHRRAGAGVTVLDGCLYAIGGFDDNAPLPSCERYIPSSDKWELLSQMSCPRAVMYNNFFCSILSLFVSLIFLRGVGVAAMGGRIYAVGGHDGLRYLNSVEAYDPVLNRWFPVATISTCRAGAGVAWADCRVDSLLRPPSMASGKDSGCAPCVTGVAHCV